MVLLFFKLTCLAIIYSRFHRGPHHGARCGYLPIRDTTAKPSDTFEADEQTLTSRL